MEEEGVEQLQLWEQEEELLLGQEVEVEKELVGEEVTCLRLVVKQLPAVVAAASEQVLPSEDLGS